MINHSRETPSNRRLTEALIPQHLTQLDLLTPITKLNQNTADTLRKKILLDGKMFALKQRFQLMRECHAPPPFSNRTTIALVPQLDLHRTVDLVLGFGSKTIIGTKP